MVLHSRSLNAFTSTPNLSLLSWDPLVPLSSERLGGVQPGRLRSRKMNRLGQKYSVRSVFFNVVVLDGLSEPKC